MTFRRIVVVGGSLAGVRAAQGLRRRGFDGELIVASGEPQAAYDRPPLSKAYLTGAVEETNLRLDRTNSLDATWLLGDPATSLDTDRRCVRLSSGGSLHYDGLVIATGAAARRPVWAALPGVDRLRTLDDASALRHDLIGRPRVVVVGGGFIGCEVATTAGRLGAQVCIVEAAPTLFCQALGPDVGRLIEQMHRAAGTSILTGVGVTALRGHERVAEVVLSDGRSIPADVVVVGLGATPAVDWLHGSGVATADGILCDHYLRTSAANVVAAGDVVKWPNGARASHGYERISHWTNASAQGAAAAATLLLGSAAPSFRAVPTFWSDQCDVKIQASGWPHRAGQAPTISTTEMGGTVAEYRNNGRLVGVATWGDVTALPRYQAELRACLYADSTKVAPV